MLVVYLYVSALLRYMVHAREEVHLQEENQSDVFEFLSLAFCVLRFPMFLSLPCLCRTIRCHALAFAVILRSCSMMPFGRPEPADTDVIYTIHRLMHLVAMRCLDLDVDVGVDLGVDVGYSTGRRAGLNE